MTQLGAAPVRVRADAGCFIGELAHGDVKRGLDCAIYAKRMHVLWAATTALPEPAT